MHIHNYFRKLKTLNTLFKNSCVFRVFLYLFEMIFALSLDRFIYVGGEHFIWCNSRNDLRKRTSALTSHEYKFCDKYVRY